MKKFYQSIILLTLTGLYGAYAQTGEWVWQQLPEVTGNAGAVANVNDASGNVYLGGIFTGEITFGTETLVNNSNQGHFYIAKLNEAGNVLWAKTGESLYSSVHDIAIDTDGNIYLTGHYKSFFTVDDTTLSAVGGNNSTDIYIMKMDPQGNVLWATNAGCPGNVTSVYPEDIEVDASGNVYVTGSAMGTTLTSGNLSYTITGERDLFVAKFTSNGTISWLKGAGTKIMAQGGCSIAVTTQGDVFVTGSYEYNPINFEGQVFENTGTWNTFLVKYNSTGAYQWAIAYHATIVYPLGIAADEAGNIFIGGVYNATSLSLGGTSSFGASQGNDVFLAKFDGNGNTLWANKFNGSGYDYSANALVYKNGLVYFTGFFGSPTLTFGTAFVQNTGAKSLFLSAFNSTGELQWLDSTGPGLQFLSVDGISVSDEGSIFLNGYFSQGMTFGSSTYTVTSNQPYLAKYNPATLSTASFKRKEVTLFPNPAKDIINISGAEDGPFTLNDVTGRIVLQGQTQANVINVSSLPSGMYLLNVNNATTKFIKE